MNYKLCSRCKFRVPGSFRSCHVCGNDSWLTYRGRTYTNISVGPKDATLLAKFKRIVADISTPGTATQRRRKQRCAIELVNEQKLESTVPTKNYVLNSLEHIEYIPARRRDLPNDTPDERELSKIRKEIEELSTWFRNYGSEGLLTNRG